MKPAAHVASPSRAPRPAPRWLGAACLLPLVAACAVGGSVDTTGSSASALTGTRTAEIVGVAPPQPETGSGRVSPDEHLPWDNGPIMSGTVHLYYIWYGQWNDDPAATIVLPALGALIGGSPFLDILSTYETPTGITAATQATLVGAYSDSGSQGLFLDNLHTSEIVSNAITTGALPSDSNGIYVVLGGSNVDFVDISVGQLCTTMCGYHEATVVNGTSIKYAFIGSPTYCFSTGQAATTAAPGCAWGSSLAAAQPLAPHGDVNADAMATALGHELAEAITDPVPGSGFYDPATGEAADLCQNEWGPTYLVSGSATEIATVSFPTQGGNLPPQNFLLMPLSANLGTGFCAMQLPKAPSCELAQLCEYGNSATTIECTGVTGDINASIVFQRDGVTFDSLLVDNLDPTQPYEATDTAAGGHTYRVCTSNANGGGSLLCTTAGTTGTCPPCTPKTCAQQDATCGTINTNCGGTEYCGACAANRTCEDNKCTAVPVCTKGKICQ